MTAANTLAGTNGKLVVDNQLVARVTQWQVSPRLAQTSEWGDSDSAGYTNRLAGRKDATFTCEGKFDSSDEQYDLFQPGDQVSAVLWMDDSSLYWDFPRAVCTEFNLTVNIDTGEVIGWTATFGADGPFYYPGQAGAGNRSLPS